MKERPILFSMPMVQAILEGRKTQTRRFVNPQPIYGLEHVKEDIFFDTHNSGVLQKVFKCPYGQPGDVLYVREEYFQYGHWEKDFTKKRKSGRQAWKFVADDSKILYRENPPEIFRKGRHHKDLNPEIPRWYKRNSRFMPKSAARIWLKVTNVRVERLNDITEEDAQAEGILIDDEGMNCYDYMQKSMRDIVPEESYQTLWESINGEGSWNANPWVWRIKYEEVSRTGKENIKF